MGKKSEYLSKVKSLTTNKEFFEAISLMINDLGNGHTDLLPSLQREYFIRTYTNLLKESPNYKVWLNELEKGTDTWAKLFNIVPLQQAKTQSLKNNIQFSSLAHQDLCMIKIKSFSSELVVQDNKMLKSVIQKALKFKNIILDIQDNSGGDTRYWQQNIVPYFINDTITYVNYIAYRNNDLVRSYLGNILNSTVNFSEISSLNSLPPELNVNDFVIHRSVNKIIPRSKKKYQGNIYLVVNDKVFSSADAFAAFCKNTNWATVVGDTTAGDGIGYDPILLTLPNSKLTVRFPGEMGLNPDGSANAEYKTAPAKFVYGTHSIDRLANFISSTFPHLNIKLDPPWLTPSQIFPLGNFAIIYPTNEKPDSLNSKIYKYVKKVNELFYHLPDSLIVPDTMAERVQLSSYNLLFYGSYLGNSYFKNLATKLPFKINAKGIKTNKLISGTDLIVIGSCFHPHNPNKYVVYYISQTSKTVQSSNSIPAGSFRYSVGNSKFQVLNNSEE